MSQTALVIDDAGRMERTAAPCVILKARTEETLGSRDTSSPEGECIEAGSITTTREVKQQ